MKKLTGLLLLVSIGLSAQSQLSVQYDPSKQFTSGMQYFKPVGNNLFVGDCIPFFYKDTYYLYWLIDSAHHAALNGLGGHQWVVSTTKDLKNWTHHPIVIGIDEDWEKSICTGSVVYSNKKFYAFYATRLINNGQVNEQLSYAISKDAINFKKQQPNPFYTSAPGYSKRDFRDPKVFTDATGAFHLFISSKKDSAVLKGKDGCLVHLESKNLKDWDVKAPVLTGQNSVPECPDYFFWKGWYYLVYSDNSNTFYVKARNPYGPWEQPQFQALNEDWSNVVKMAGFTNDRQIAAGWVPSRLDNKDAGREMFGGNIVFRELVQQPDGTLATKFPAEMIPKTFGPLNLNLNLKLVYDSLTAKEDNQNFVISASNGIGAANLDNIPLNSRITLEIEPLGRNEEYGLYLRSGQNAAGGYRLSFSAIDRNIKLNGTSITGVTGLDKLIKVDIIMKDDIIDVCIDNKRCIVNRSIDEKGNFLWFYAKHGKVKFKSVKVSPLLDN